MFLLENFLESQEKKNPNDNIKQKLNEEVISGWSRDKGGAGVGML